MWKRFMGAFGKRPHPRDELVLMALSGLASVAAADAMLETAAGLLVFACLYGLLRALR